MTALRQEQLAGEVEVLVGVVAVPDPVCGQAEDGWVETLLDDAHRRIL
jgi:hypothetical protein